MTMNYLTTFLQEGYQKGLTKVTVDLETAEDDNSGTFYTTKFKETYVFGDEVEADDMINSVRLDPGFISAEKKFKQGKMNKAGEIVKPDTWTVVIKIKR